MDNLLLLSGILSPITELFPSLGYSYFLPRDKDVKYYNKKIFERLIVVIIVWLPIFNKLYKISKNKSIIAILFILSAFLLRVDGVKHKKNNIHTLLYAIGFIIIGSIRENKYLPILLIFVGGSIMSMGRYGNFKIDLIGRLIFTTGFVFFITNLINKGENISKKIFISILLISLILYFGINMIDKKKIKYHYDKSNLTTIHRLNKVLRENNKYQLSDSKNNSKLILPAIFNNETHRELIKELKKYTNKIFFTIPNNYVLGNKYTIWKTLVKKYGKYKASTIMPFTYLFPNDYDEYQKNLKNKELLIFKTNQHRQKGLFITDSNVPKQMIKNEKILVAQKYLKNPLLYKKHKINFRLYLLVIYSDFDKNIYVFDDGIISYTKNKYKYNKNDDNNISSFYDSKNLYDKKFPITLKKILSEIPNSKKIIQNSYSQIKLIMNACDDDITKNIDFNGNICSEIFGVDIYVDKNLNTKVLEINIGPGMIQHNKEDDKIRDDLFKNILSLLNGDKNNFIKL